MDNSEYISYEKSFEISGMRLRYIQISINTLYSVQRNTAKIFKVQKN